MSFIRSVEFVSCEARRMTCVNVFRFVFPQTGEWTDHEQSLLTRAMIKFPGGTPNRWEKIAVEIGRSVEEVSHLAACLGFVSKRAISALTATISDLLY